MAIAAFNTVNTSTPTTCTFSGASAATLTSAYGLLAWVKKTSTTAPVLAAGSTSWTLLDGDTASTTVGLWLYARRGDGTTNSITFTAATAAIHLQAYPGVYDNAWVTGYVKSAGPAVQTGMVSDTVTSTEDGMAASGYWATNASNGSTLGPSWSGGYTAQSGTSASSALGWQEKSLPTSGTSATSTLGWTTSRNMVMGIALMRLTAPVTGPEFFLWTSDGTLTHPLNLLGVKTA